MKRKLTAWLAALLLALTGCSLARPEAGDGAQDSFAGFFVTYDPSGSGRDGFYDNPNVTEYGSTVLNTEYGKFSIPKEILVAEEKDGRYSFPGMEGYSLFLVCRDGGNCIDSASDLADNTMEISDTDEGVTRAISGTLYLGPPLDAGPAWDWYEQSGILTFYRVYETPDGVIYLDGTGNSTNGPGSYREFHTSAGTISGETTSVTADVTVNVTYAPRLEHLVVSQFDQNNALLRSDDLALREDLPEVACMAETAWALVEEHSAEGTVRTAYGPPGDGETAARHSVVLLDDEGRGRTADLTIQFPDAHDLEGFSVSPENQTEILH